MKNLIYTFLLLVLVSCSPDKLGNCFTSSGAIIQREIPVSSFNKITAWDRTRLFIQQGAEHKVVVETGSNLIEDVIVSVVDGRLEIRDNNSCNLVRDYGITKIYVTSPNITEIRSSTGYAIESIGTLTFPELSLLSEDFNSGEYHTDGDFKFDLNVGKLNVVANGMSKFYLSGNAESASFGLYAGDCRIYSENLIVQDLQLFHRSSGPMVVNPHQSIKGKIVSIGNVICKTRPSIVEVEELYKGRLVFE
ncbi:DUF2807 domain-containing protein [Aequorivita sp. H23M31]|uniref:DUF2807 domain-containing protein n=1 Tax=Aequorivita ciconiae TaxID=2494375 RepID=A0A410G6C9_9FLAO|nr:head GIN domain-containing protein [Aequorivita sp. H23M31]QAA82839.1 DUF2807 domain-containing protein [Aequorivita sp. H23M31]